jgi:hypothetical protein
LKNEKLQKPKWLDAEDATPKPFDLSKRILRCPRFRFLIATALPKPAATRVSPFLVPLGRVGLVRDSFVAFFRDKELERGCELVAAGYHAVHFLLG